MTDINLYDNVHNELNRIKEFKLNTFNDSFTYSLDVLKSLIENSHQNGNAVSLIASLDSYLEVLLDPNCKFSKEQGEDTIGIILYELDFVPPYLYPYFIDKIIFKLNDARQIPHYGSTLNILPKLLNSIDNSDYVISNEEMLDAQEYKNRVIKDYICDNSWETFLIPMISNLKELKVDQSLFTVLCECINHQLLINPIDSLPPAIYQYLLYSSNANVNMQLVFKGIFECFKKLDNPEGPNYELIRNICGTLLVTFDIACNRDQKIAFELIKSQQSEDDMTTFSIALLMSLPKENVSIQNQSKVSEKAFNLLKSKILSSFQHSSSNENSFMKKIKNVLYHTRNGWDTCIYTFLNLAFFFMDYREPVNYISDIISFGQEVLFEIYKHHKMVRNNVLDKLCMQIFSKNDRSIEYIHIIKRISVEIPTELLNYSNNIKEVFNFIPFVDPNVTSEFIKAVYPLMILQPNLLDHALLVLRKSLFSREENTRLSSISGFLEILYNISLSDENKQVSSVVHDIFGFIKRGLSQKSDVRSFLYKYLYNIFKESSQKSNTPFHRDIREKIIDIFYSQIISNIDIKEAIPILLDKCLDKESDDVIVKEPFHILVNTIQKCINVDSIDNYSLTNELCSLFNEFTDKLLETSLKHFELNQTSDFNLKTVEGLYNNQLSTTLIGTCESFLEYILMERIDIEKSNNISHELKKIIDLFNYIISIKNNIKTSNNQKKKSDDNNEKNDNNERQDDSIKVENKNNIKNALIVQSLLSQHCIIKLLKLINYEQDDLIKLKCDELETLSNDPSFRSYVHNACLSRLKLINKEKNDLKHILTCNMNSSKFCFEVSKHLIYEIKKLIANINSNEHKHQSSNLLTLIECYTEAFKYWVTSKVKNDDIKNLSLFLSQSVRWIKSDEIIAKNILSKYQKHIKKDGNKDAIYEVTRLFVRLIETFFKELLSKKKFKESDLLQSIISMIVPYMTMEDIRATFLWLKELLTFSLENVNITNKLVSLYWRLGLLNHECLDDLFQFLTDIMLVRGTNDPDINENEIKDQIEFGCISQQTVSSIISQLIKIIDSQIMQYEKNNIDGNQSLLFESMKNTISLVTLLICIRIPYNCCKSLSLLVTKIYKVLCNWSANLTSGKSTEISKEYEDLIDTCAFFTEKVYVFIAYWQNRGIEGEDGDSDDEEEEGVRRTKKRKKISSSQYSQIVPQMIYWIERLQTAYIIKIDDKLNTELMDKFKRSTNRDWRIKLENNEVGHENKRVAK